MSQIGFVNFDDLEAYLWNSKDDFKGMQTLIYNAIQTLAGGVRTPGLIYGGQLSIVSGLTIRVAAGFAIFSSGKIVTWPQTDLPLDAADPTNPRIDRIELVYAVTNNRTVVNKVGESKWFNKYEGITLTANKGTPSGSPSANAKVAGNISVGLVTIPPGSVSLVGGNLNTTEDSACELSALRFDESSRYIRNNRSLGRLEYTNDGTNWDPIAAQIANFTIANNVSVFTDITGIEFDKTKIKSAIIKFDGYRKDNAQEYSSNFTVVMNFMPVANTWTYQVVLDSGNFDALGLTFNATSSGKLQYKSSNFGSSYVGTFRMIIETFKV